MNTTINEHVANQRRAFRQLSQSRQNQLAADAKGFVFRNPGSADHSNFWRGLSARQVIETAYQRPVQRLNVGQPWPPHQSTRHPLNQRATR